MVMMDKSGMAKRAAWLEDNKVYQGALDGSDGFSFPDEFYDNRLFLFGEIHGYAPPQEFDLAILTHLNERLGVRYYLAELDPAQALVVNDYFVTGDDGKLRLIFDEWAKESAQWGNKEFFKKLQSIRVLNETLPSERKIGFVGVDAPQSDENFNSFAAESATMDASHPAQAINLALIDSAKARDSGSRYHHIIENLEALMSAPSMAEEKIYGFWGFYHVLETVVNDSGRPLAMRAAEMDEFKDGVASMFSSYGPGSFMMAPSEFMPPPVQGKNGEAYVLVPAGMDNPYIQYTSGVNELSLANAEAPVSVFHLDGEDSPYLKGDRFFGGFGLMSMMHPFNVKGSTAEASDYVVYFEKASALTPWKGEAYDASGKAK